MTSQAFDQAIDEAVAQHGEKRVLEAIAAIGSAQANSHDCLTIVANKGVHHLPTQLLRGEVYFASEGSLDFTTQDSVRREMLTVLGRLASKLKERAWKQIYLVPFGPTNLSMLIKLLVYRVTHIETTDVFHAGSGSYFDLEISLRPIVIEARE